MVYGPRRTGKTTLINEYLKKITEKKIYKGSGEDIRLKEILEFSDFSRIIPYFKNYNIIFIDEAQKIENIGNGLKILVDNIKNIKIIATGSSSFDLSNKVGEPLVGRQHILTLYPFSISELSNEFGNTFAYENLNNLMVYSSYPEVITSKTFKEKVNYLNQIRSSYLYKDILELENIKNSGKINDLLRLISYQIGKEISLEELGTQLQMSKNTVQKYLDLLEKSFILIKSRGFSKNLRKEISKKPRYYFYDNGIRNSVIQNFNHIEERNDIGELWENFVLVERIKKQTYQDIYSNNYFWRTWDKKEVDFIEERGGKIYGFEFKYNKEKIPKNNNFLDIYPEANLRIINKNNFFDFLT